MDDPELPKSTQEFLNPPADPGVIPPEERQMAMFVHLSALSTFFTAVGGILGPILVWQINKEKMPSLEEVAKEAVNFNITVFIGYVISAVLVPVFCIGFITALIVGIAHIVLIIMAAMKANEGVYYRYPATIRLWK